MNLNDSRKKSVSFASNKEDDYSTDEFKQKNKKLNAIQEESSGSLNSRDDYLGYTQKGSIYNKQQPSRAT